MQPDFSPITDAVARIMVPVTVSMVMGLVALVAVAFVARQGFSRQAAVKAGEAAMALTTLVCLYVGLVLPHGGGIAKATASLGLQPTSSLERQFSAEPRCGWAISEARRLNSSGLGSAAVYSAADALKRKAAQSFCLAGGYPVTSYPSYRVVEGYIFRLRDGQECHWSRDAYLRLASSEATGGMLMELQAHTKQTEVAGCFRY